MSTGKNVSAAAIALGLVLAATGADAQGSRSGGSGVLRNANPTRRSLGTIPTPPAPAAAHASQIAVPRTQLGPLAPLSSSTSTATGVPTALPTGGSSGVLLSTPGGGREGLAACLEFWDRATHMTKAEWKASCKRSVNRLETVTGTKKP